MSRIFALVAVAVLLFGAPLVADLALQNDINEPNSTSVAQNQTQMTETAGQFVGVAPYALFALVVGGALVGVRAAGGRGGL